MAQLKDLVINGSTRIIGAVYIGVTTPVVSGHSVDLKTLIEDLKTLCK